MKKNRLYTILILIFTGIFMTGAIQIYRQLKDYGEGESSYTEIEQYVWVEEAPEDSGDEEQNGSQSGEEEPDLRWPAIDFDALSEINSDIVAWIYIEDTEINYPVVQGTDNQYYLKRLFNGKWNGSGCIFLDSRNSPDLSDRHSIIYGHHMKNGTMFSGLTEYKKQGFYEGHPVVLLMMLEQNVRVEIFAGYVARVSDKAWEIALGSDVEFREWMEEAKERSCFKSEITPAVTDRIVTLSTCNYEFDNARFVLLGVVRDE
ncbi:class B sortase [Petralouisia muris]|uniref:Class B sortase n=1 Tax=Petralouisia muris TaxID=3032872 RepID=A0AC61RUS4_9FIRM|nr:class B sortase [Petralouisia muris]TGY95255.1 class B sortase [Petralouisia muris]